MKILQGVLVALAFVICCRTGAQAQQPAYGIPVVGQSSSCTPGQGLRCTNLSTDPYLLLGGFWSPGDNGGGYLALQGTNCTDNGGTIFKDSAGDCFYRTDSRDAIPVQWFGARCDAVTTVVGGSIAAGSTAFTSSASGVAFQPGDVGKTFELNYQSATPFVTTIAGYTSGTQVTLASAAPTTYPAAVGAASAGFNPQLANGLDSPGAGYKPQDLLTVTCSGCGPSVTPTTVTVRATGLVGNGLVSGGTGYAVGDSIYLTASPASNYTTVSAAEVQVTSVSGGGVTGYTIISNGDFRPTSSSITANPTTFTTSTSGAGSGASVYLAPSDASFGVAEVFSTPANPGAYNPSVGYPAIPSPTTDSGAGSGATIDLTFPTPTWTYGTDDTTALQALETWMEQDYDRGIYNAAEVPGAHTCLLQTLQIKRPVTWRSSGSREGELMEVMGSQGSTIDGSNTAFLLVTVSSSPVDPYQGFSVGESEVGFNNLMLNGGTASQAVNVNGTTVSYTNDGLLFQNPATGKSKTNSLLQNLQVLAFPGHALAANAFAGEMRGYNVYAGQSGGNCVDLRATDNPYRFYGLVASGCTSGAGINLQGTQSEEFHGVSVYHNMIGVSLTGARPRADAYVLFDGAQFQGAQQENLYLDQQNETFLCAANCVFEKAWLTPCMTGQSCSAIEIGPNARSKATRLTPIIAQFNQGLFSDSPVYDVYFDTNPSGAYCKCRVALGSGMVDVGVQSAVANPGQPTTNYATNLTGQTTYAPPVFANAASVGQPLNLYSTEFGIGTSPQGQTDIPTGTYGLKFRVECSTAHPGEAKLVVLAGSSLTETVLADGIGGGVTCPPP